MKMSRINISKVVISYVIGVIMIAVAPLNLGITPHAKLETAEHAGISVNESI
jgi:hypothetical protein